MLAYFPVAYPDELLYSIIARYALHTGQSGNNKAVLRDVFGSESAVAIPDLPSHLTALTKNLESVWPITTSELIKRHTLAPVYLPFLPPEKAAAIIKSMSSDQGGCVHTRSGIAASSISQPQFFRYCPACTKEQKTIHGELYWQRTHQLSGLEHCPEHQCELVSSALHLHPKEKHLYRAAIFECHEQNFRSVALIEIELKLYAKFQELLELQKITGYSFHQWTVFYQALAAGHGLKHGSRVDHEAMRQKIMADWQYTNFSTYLKPVSRNEDWLVKIFRTHRKSFHPLRHLIIWTSLLPDENIRDVFNRINKIPSQAETLSKGFHSKIDENSEIVQKKRKRWLQLLKSSKGKGIKAIRAEQPGGALYAWLYRNDRHWLMTHRPEKVMPDSFVRKTDYEQWDKENLEALPRIVISLLEQPERSRITKTLLIKQLPRANSVAKHLKDLPETAQWLEEHAETLEAYQMLRIQKAAELLNLQVIQVKQWRLLRIAGIRERSLTRKTKELIKKLEH